MIKFKEKVLIVVSPKINYKINNPIANQNKQIILQEVIKIFINEFSIYLFINNYILYSKSIKIIKIFHYHLLFYLVYLLFSIIKFSFNKINQLL